MSKKYQQLVEKYAKEIASLKAAKAKADEAKKRCNAFEAESDDDYYYSEQLAHDWDLADREYTGQAAQLNDEIWVEYQDVPFAKARKQGIEKFWEIVNL